MCITYLYNMQRKALEAQQTILKDYLSDKKQLAE